MHGESGPKVVQTRLVTRAVGSPDARFVAQPAEVALERILDDPSPLTGGEKRGIFARPRGRRNPAVDVIGQGSADLRPEGDQSGLVKLGQADSQQVAVE